jgi:hypothetical protein
VTEAAPFVVRAIIDPGRDVDGVLAGPDHRGLAVVELIVERCL